MNQSEPSNQNNPSHPKNLYGKQLEQDQSFAYLAGRLVKLIANTLRPAFYFQYWLFQNKRYNVKGDPAPPAYIKNNIIGLTKSESLIPKIIWQTNYTTAVSLPVKATIKWNMLCAQGYKYCIHTDKDQLEFIQHFFPGQILNTYNRLTIGAAKADLWRLLVLYIYGGIYIDMDAHLIWPLHRIVTPDTPEIFLRYKNLEATNYFIASMPKNENLKAIIEEVISRIQDHSINNVYHITGPGVFEEILRNRQHNWRLTQHTCLQGNFSNKFFQYLDKPNGCWTMEQQQRRVVNP